MFSISGDPDLYYSWTIDINSSSYRVRENQHGQDQIILCPSDPNFRTGIVYIGVYCYQSMCSYRLKLQSRFVAFTFIPGDESRLVDWGKYTSSFRRLAITPPPDSCALHVSIFGGPALLSVHYRGKVYQATQYLYEGRSYLDLSLCRWENGTQVLDVENITAEVKFGNGTTTFVQLFYTSYHHYEYVPLVDYPPLSVLNFLNYSIILNSHLCDVKLNWSSVTGNAFNPPIPEFFMDNNIDPDYFVWNYSYTSNPFTLYTFLQLSTPSKALDIMDHQNALCFWVNNFVVDQNGIGMENQIICPTARIVHCDKDQFHIVDDMMRNALENLFYNVTDAHELVYLDILRYDNRWATCVGQVNSYFEWDRIGNGHVQLIDLKDDLDLWCDNPNCTSLFLDDYEQNSNWLADGKCEAADVPLDVGWYRKCKKKMFSVESGKKGRKCESDDDCIITANCTNGKCAQWGGNCTIDEDCNVPTVCDYWSNICTDTKQVIEGLFLNCYIDLMPRSVQGYLAEHGVQIEDKNSAEYFNKLRELFLTETLECVSKSGTGMDALVYRDHYAYSAGLVTIQDQCACYQTIGEGYDLCLDYFCNRPPECEFTSYRYAELFLTTEESSLRRTTCEYDVYFIQAENNSCVNEMKCNWNAEGALSENECTSTTLSSNLCGVRFDSSVLYYHEVVNVSKDKCENENAWVCVTPLKAIIWGGDDQTGLTKDNCNNIKGMCTALCNRTEAACVATNMQKQSVCLSKEGGVSEQICKLQSGKWVKNSLNGFGVCEYWLQNSREECERNGNTFVECKQFNVTDCETMSSRVTSELLECVVDSWDMCEVGECNEETAGRCEDNDVIPAKGACVMPFREAEGQKFCFADTELTQIG